MQTLPARRPRWLAARCCVALAALIVPLSPAVADAAAPVIKVTGGKVRGTMTGGALAFRGVPYAAAPTGRLRWRAPQPPTIWHGVRDAASFGANCPQPETPFTPGATAEDCLFLNVSTPSLHSSGRPVLVWFHGGGLVVGAGSDYEPATLAADGTVVVTINYRLGALGFLAHPALADRDGAAGNYGLMDQQAALRWVRDNIARFGGDPHNVTIAGQSAGGLSVLLHLISRSSRSLFQRAIVQSGAFALKQRSLAEGETDGKALAAKAGCPDQSADCLRKLPVADLVANGAGNLIPGIIDGKVVTQSVGPALAAGRFNRVPIINGVNHDEERLFLSLGSTVTNGEGRPLSEPVTADSYQRVIASSFGVAAARAAAIAAEYPLGAYPDPVVAFSTLQSDANFACPAAKVDRWTSERVATYAYEFRDDAAPERFVPQLATPNVATHQTELQYLFGLPNAPLPGPLTSDQKRLSASMQNAWAGFAKNGAPTAWPKFDGRRVLSLVAPRPMVETDFAARHHCGFWAGEGR